MAHFIVSRGCMHVVPDVPEGVDGCLGVPEFDDVRLMKTEQCLHRLLCHVRHRLLVDQRHKAVDQLQCTALDLVPSLARVLLHAHVHTHSFDGPLSGTTRVSRYQKGKSNLDFTEARDSEWQWHQLSHMQVCTLLQTDSLASTQFFTSRGMPFLPPNQHRQSTEGITRVLLHIHKKLLQ